MVLSGSSSAGTAFVEFDNVKVQVENRVGEERKAFKYIVSNFNHEVGNRTVCRLLLRAKLYTETLHWHSIVNMCSGLHRGFYWACSSTTFT